MTHRMKLLAYMLGDGNMTGGVPRFTNANPAIRKDFIESIGEFGGLGTREETSGGTRTPTVCVCADRVVVRRHRQTFARTLRRAMLESRLTGQELTENESRYPPFDVLSMHFYGTPANKRPKGRSLAALV